MACRSRKSGMKIFMQIEWYRGVYPSSQCSLRRWFSFLRLNIRSEKRKDIDYETQTYHTGHSPRRHHPLFHVLRIRKSHISTLARLPGRNRNRKRSRRNGDHCRHLPGSWHHCHRPIQRPAYPFLKSWNDLFHHLYHSDFPCSGAWAGHSKKCRSLL